MVPITSQLAFFLLVILCFTETLSIRRECFDYPLGNDVDINANCHLNGTVRYQAHVKIRYTGVLIQYNCTGPDPVEGISLNWARNSGPTEQEEFNVSNWNYTNSVCYLYGCYSQRDPPFSTYSIASVACTVITPTRVQVRPTSMPPDTTMYSSIGILVTPRPSVIAASGKMESITLTIITPSVTSSFLVLLLIAVLAALFLMVASRRRKFKSAIYPHNLTQEINDDDKEIDVTKCNNIKASMETLTDQLYYGEVYYDEVGDIMGKLEQQQIMKSSTEKDADSESDSDTIPLSERSPDSNCPCSETSGYVDNSSASIPQQEAIMESGTKDINPTYHRNNSATELMDESSSTELYPQDEELASRTIAPVLKEHRILSPHSHCFWEHHEFQSTGDTSGYSSTYNGDSSGGYVDMQMCTNQTLYKTE